MLKRTSTTVALVLSGSAAQAHHVMGGAMPETFAQGLVSGLAHPVIGLDHFAFVVAAGILAAPLARGPLIVLVFLAGGVLGAALHLAGLDLPGSEVAIALSVVALAGLVLVRRSAPAPVLAALFAAAGVFHGYALTETIVGAESTPLAAYFAGLIAVQYGVALAALCATRWITAARPALARQALAGVGVLTLAVGLTCLLGAALA
jgi:urease accessory protein